MISSEARHLAPTARRQLALLIVVSVAAAASSCQNPQWGLTAAPSFNLSSGVYSSNQFVVIRNNATGASLHYTTDGSDPTVVSPSGSGPIVVAGEALTKTIKAVAIGGQWGSQSAISSVRIGIAYSPLALSNTVATLAGDGSMRYVDGVGTAASFNQPYGIATDGANLYVADNGNNCIRSVGISSGLVTTIAGNGTSGYADGVGTAASFSQPYGIATDGTSLYVADSVNNRIRKVVIATGVVSTLAGNGEGAYADGVGTEASFNLPCGIATDGTNLYVADSLNNRIRRIVISTSEVTTVAGSGVGAYADGAGTSASFNYPFGIATDGKNLYVVDGGNNRIRRIVVSTYQVTTLAGNGTATFVDGVGTGASFNAPFGLATDGTNVYVADTANNRIRKIAISTGVVTTLAGNGSAAYLDEVGTAASFYGPQCIATDGKSLYVADTSNNRIRCIK